MGKEIACPTCDAELLLDGTEVKGDTIFCVYCSAPLTVTKPAGDDGEIEMEEDY
jgi:hypothetical protein